MSSCVCSTAYMGPEPWREARLGFFHSCTQSSPKLYPQKHYSSYMVKTTICVHCFCSGAQVCCFYGNFYYVLFTALKKGSDLSLLGSCGGTWGGFVVLGGQWRVAVLKEFLDSMNLWWRRRKNKLCKPSTLGFQLWGMGLLIATEINSNPVVMLILKKHLWYFVWFWWWLPRLKCLPKSIYRNYESLNLLINKFTYLFFNCLENHSWCLMVAVAFSHLL